MRDLAWCLGKTCLLVLFVVGSMRVWAQQNSLGGTWVTAAPFEGELGRHLTFICPRNVDLNLDVFGSEPYTTRSSICTAAVHAGVLTPGISGAVTIVIGGSAASFTGTERNGVKSLSEDWSGATYTFSRDGKPGVLDWNTTYEDVADDFQLPVTVSCPANGVISYAVWGTDVYTNSSAICVSALHAGVITLKGGGNIKLTRLPKQEAFLGSERNGVDSKSSSTPEWQLYPPPFKVTAADSTTTLSAGNGLTGLTVQFDQQGKAFAQWNGIPGAAYLATRWKVGDANCCNAASPPGAPLTTTRWQDGALPSAGTYAYRVFALAGDAVYFAETRVVWPPPAPPAPPAPPPPATTGVPKTGATPVTDAGLISTTGNRPSPSTMGNGPAPTVTVIAPSALQVAVSWTAPSGATGYELQRRDDGQQISSLTNGRVTATTWSDSITNPSVTYEYMVIAYQADGTFGSSAWVPFKPRLINPAGFTARQSATGEATLQWQAVPGAQQYRIDGAGLANTGRIVDGTSTVVTPLSAGAYSWQVAAIYPGNLMDLTTRPTANLTVTNVRPPFLSMNNGPGNAGDATAHMMRGFSPTCDGSTLVQCVRIPDILQRFDDGATNGLIAVAGNVGYQDPPTGSLGAGLYFSAFSDQHSLAAARYVYCVQKGSGTAIVRTLCWAVSRGQYGNSITMIQQEADGLRFAAFDYKDGSATAAGTWDNAKVSTVFDAEGQKFLPHACLACHGGQYDPATHKVTGASLLPIDPKLVVFDQGRDRSSQEEALRNINLMVLNSKPSDAIVKYVRGLYGGSPEATDTKSNDDYVPADWSGHEDLYQRVVKPYCATCHMAQTSRNDFSSYDNFVGLKERVKQMVCVQRSMPHSQPQFNSFWQDDGTGGLPAFLLGAIGMGSCSSP